MPEQPQVIQFVGFETALSREGFLPRWEPFAASFVARGIERVVLGEGDAAGGLRFISRNVWHEARFRAVFPSRLPGDAGGGAVTAVQLGVFRVVASDGVELLVARRGVVESIALARCRHDALGAIVLLLGELGRQHSAGVGWAAYTADPAVRGGRFKAVLEVYAAEEAAAWVGVALAEALQRQAARIEESRVQLLREVLARP
ncbi:MAG: hypothetical protein INH41_12230 [Myxococcaceae bacterium]|nr:hypothetical protein [Myxococcaceae bacterium]MCA3013153.1 hypothetical protein [Myxococcaceae bacterium]